MVNHTALFAETLAAAVAKRIAIAAMTDREAAEKDYEMHVSAMSADEAALFEHMILVAAMELREVK